MNNDLISREALKKALRQRQWHIDDIEEVMKIINNAPTVHHPNCDICEDKAKSYSMGFQDGYLTGKERPQGEWIITSEDTEGIHHIACPFCKYEKGSDFEPYIRVTFDKLPPFCEKCGADMRGKEE